MATIGLRDLYRAPITIGTDGAEDYGTPVRMAKAISAEISVEVAEAILYADDGADEVVKEFVSGEITLNVNDLLPADLAALLGQKQDADKVVYGADTDEAPYFAIGFRAKKAGGTYKYIWLYKGQVCRSGRKLYHEGRQYRIHHAGDRRAVHQAFRRLVEG